MAAKKQSRKHSKRSNKRNKKKGTSLLKRIWKFVFRLGLLGLLALCAFIGSVYLGFWGPLPDSGELKSIQQSQASLVYSSDKQLIGSFYTVNRDPVKYTDLPEHLLNALVATEDQRFYDHSGIDLRSLVRVAVKSILLQDASAGGGSTLTQQLVKNLYGRPDFGLLSMPVNKTREMILAWRLEAIYSKKEILALYLNTVSFSENTYGISAGSQRFFNCAPAKLKIEEAAVLVGLLKANTYYNPRLNPEHSTERRNLVLSLMESGGYLSLSARDSLQKLPLKLDYSNLELEGPAPYYLAQLEKELKLVLDGKLKANGENWDAKKDGLRIYSTLDAGQQEALSKAFKNHLAQWQKKFDAHWSRQEPWHSQASFFDRKLHQTRYYKMLAAKGLSEAEIYQQLKEEKNMELFHPAGNVEGKFSSLDSLAHYLKLLRGASILMDPNSGAIKSWLGGPDFRYLPFDAAQAPHTMASTVKPFILAAALEEGADPCDYVSAERRQYPEHKDWSPRNYDGKYEGFYSMQGTLKKSINTATIAWYFKTGGAKIKALAEGLGMAENWVDGPSAALGTSSLSPMQLAVAYSSFANGGMSVEPYFIERIEAADGSLIYQRDKSPRTRVLKSETCMQINSFLQAVVNDGTARRLKSGYGAKFPWAAKTGTSQNYSDAWLVAYQPNLVSVSWVGGSSPLIRFRTGALGSGSTMALPIFGAFLQTYEGQLKRPQWPELSPQMQERIDCPDFKEGDLFDDLRSLFDKKEGEKVKSKDDSKEEDSKEKGSWFRRLFKKKD